MHRRGLRDTELAPMSNLRARFADVRRGPAVHRNCRLERSPVGTTDILLSKKQRQLARLFTPTNYAGSL